MNLRRHGTLVRRRDEWGRQVEERLKRLEAERGVRLEDLRDSEEFITVVTRASQTAMRARSNVARACRSAAQRELYELVANELAARGLVDSPDFHTMMSGRGWEARRTKALGHSFIEFITDPMLVEDAVSGAD